MTPRRIPSHKFRGKTYHIKWLDQPRYSGGDCDGACSTPEKATIELKKKLRQKRLLKVAIDEGVHACLWDLDNDAVDEISESIHALLWRLGYRLTNRK